MRDVVWHERGRPTEFTRIGTYVGAPLGAPRTDAEKILPPDSSAAHFEEQAAARRLVDGPFRQIPYDKRNTPYSRLWDTEVPEVPPVKKFMPGY